MIVNAGKGLPSEILFLVNRRMKTFNVMRESTAFYGPKSKNIDPPHFFQQVLLVVWIFR